MKILIVDDENQGRLLVKAMLKELNYDSDHIAEASSVRSAIDIIPKFNPELVFLDIQLGDGDGFDVLQAFPDANFQVVFATGYDEYTIKALQHGATDYLLKPILFDSFEEALMRVQKRNNRKDQKQTVNTGVITKDRILIKTGNKYNVFPYHEVFALEAELSYTRIHLKDKQSLLSAYPLRHFINTLPEPFMQIHRSWMVNIQLVKSYDKGRGGNIQMSNDQNIPIAFRRKAEFIQKFKSSQ